MYQQIMNLSHVELWGIVGVGRRRRVCVSGSKADANETAVTGVLQGSIKYTMSIKTSRSEFKVSGRCLPSEFNSVIRGGISQQPALTIVVDNGGVQLLLLAR
jgi:hypothetical protein